MKKISFIIPTFGRSESVLYRTIDSILNSNEIKSTEFEYEIFIIDQNYPSLDFNKYNNVEKIYVDSNLIKIKDKNKIFHLYGMPPSVTKAKNTALDVATGDYLIFFDDDIEVHEYCIKNYIQVLDSNSNIGFLGGREIVPDVSAQRKKWKSLILDFLQLFTDNSDHEYMFNGKYIGRIKPNSTMFWNFNVDTEKLIRIDSARGCNWATTKSALGDLRFDPNFKGSALREETDLYLRILSKGLKGYYVGRSVVTHYRQLGGCGNLLSDISAFISKLDNESYFQRKHFKNLSKIRFFLRMTPLALEYFKPSYGASFILLLKATIQL